MTEPKSGLQSAADYYANRQPVAIPMSQARIDQCALSMEYVMDAAESSKLDPAGAACDASQAHPVSGLRWTAAG
jgi:hypothetical protein